MIWLALSFPLEGRTDQKRQSYLTTFFRVFNCSIFYEFELNFRPYGKQVRGLFDLTADLTKVEII